MSQAKLYKVDLVINNHIISKALIGRRYELKQASCMNDELILKLLKLLYGGFFPVDSTTSGIEYYVAAKYPVLNPSDFQ